MNFQVSENPLFKTRVPNQALSVYTYFNDSPPLAPADSLRFSLNADGERWESGGSHGSIGSPENLPPLDLNLEESSGYNSGSEASNIARPSDSTSPALGSSLLLTGVAIPPLRHHSSSSRSDSIGRPVHASPDSRPPARVRQLSVESLPGAVRETLSFAGGVGQMRIGGGHMSSDDMRDGSDIVPIQANNLDDYEFPRHRLPLRLRDESMEPLVIVACGSFSPCTYLHLRIFEMAKDAIFEGNKYEIMAGYYSPVADAYRKSGLAAAHHRVRMCEIGVENTSSWLMVDAWESLQSEYTRTADVLDHFDQEINGDGGITLADGTKKRVRIMLLAGGDLIQSFGEPGVWSEPDLVRILGGYGCLVVERTGSDVWAFLLSHDILWKYRKNCIVIKQLIYNDISSTKVRLFVRRRMSIKYLLPSAVITYIQAHGLYSEPEPLAPPSP